MDYKTQKQGERAANHPPNFADIMLNSAKNEKPADLLERGFVATN